MNSRTDPQLDAAQSHSAAGYLHSLGIKTCRELYAWGRNEYGELGDGTETSRMFPELIDSDFAAVGAGYDHSLAIRGDRELYTWGYNADDQLGDDSMTMPTSPVRIPVPYWGYFRFSHGVGRVP